MDLLTLVKDTLPVAVAAAGVVLGMQKAPEEVIPLQKEHTVSSHTLLWALATLLLGAEMALNGDAVNINPEEVAAAIGLVVAAGSAALVALQKMFKGN